jgi:TldD protein
MSSLVSTPFPSRSAGRSCTRREFVATTSCAFAGTVIATHGIAAQHLPADLRRCALPATAFLPEPLAPLDLQQLATHAIDAATRAGAAYADVRVAERHVLILVAAGQIELRSTFTYGVRALVDGGWAFVHGSDPEVDAITTSARDAVAMAKGYAPLVVKRAELAPAPVVTGEWTTPIQEDPFTVPLRDQYALISNYYNAVRERLPSKTGVQWTGIGPLTWTKEHRAVATSEGTLTTQHLYGGIPVFNPYADLDYILGKVVLRSPALHAFAGGFEQFANLVQHDDAFLALAENAERFAMLPKRTLDVGRYPMVLDGSVLGLLFGGTVGQALELDRVLGEEADTSGTSYLAPPLELLGTPVMHPQLTVTASRTAPLPSAVKWDDEGVEPHDYPVITKGTLVDYHTSRWTAPALQSWYAKQNRPLASHGCAVASEANDPLTVRAPHLRIAPSPTISTLDTLCREVKNGLLVVGSPEYSTDQQFKYCNLNAPLGGPEVGVFLKIENGKIVGRVQRNGFDISTQKLWKNNLIALGDASTMEFEDFSASKGMPWRWGRQSTEAPAGLFKDVNVTRHPSRF